MTSCVIKEYNSLLYLRVKIEYRINIGRRVREVVVGGNQVPSQVPAAVGQVPISSAGLKDGEVWEAFRKMAKAITTQANPSWLKTQERVLPGINRMLAPCLTC